LSGFAPPLDLFPVAPFSSLSGSAPSPDLFLVAPFDSWFCHDSILKPGPSSYLKLGLSSHLKSGLSGHLKLGPSGHLKSESSGHLDVNVAQKSNVILICGILVISDPSAIGGELMLTKSEGS
jgi:hypothetical protein